jgi:hypothetical protein
MLYPTAYYLRNRFFWILGSETIWLSSLPFVDTASGSMALDKLGSAVDPLDANLQCDGKWYNVATIYTRMRAKWASGV